MNSLPKLSWLPIGLLIGSVLVACGQPVPVQELADARAEIAGAAAVKAQEHAPDQYAAARAALLAAHQLLADEKPDDARAKAEEARNSGLAARFDAAPKYVAAQKAAAATALQEADDAYAEVLAKDDFEAAKKLAADGEALSAQAAPAASAAGDDPAKKGAAAAGYEAAGRKYVNAQDAARRAKNKALAQKDDLLDSLSGVETLLRRAEQYRAAELAPEQYNAAKTEIAQARTDISSGQLKRGNGHILKAEELSRAALNAVLQRYASDKKAQAARAVSGSDEAFKKSPAAAQADPEVKAKAGRIKEMLNAAHESVASADKSFAGNKYEDSIKDSEEALRLSGIIREQLAALDQEAAMLVRRRGGPESKKQEPGKTEVTTTSVAGWKTYVVQKKKPADCLWRIAGSRQHYGNPWQWKKIYQANRSKIKDPNLIYPGQVLLIPPRNYRGGKPPASMGKTSKDVQEKKTEPATQPRENIE